MKNLTILTIILLTAITAFAQKQDAEGLLKQLSETNKSYDNIQADFNFHYKNLQSDNQNEWSGTIIMEGEKYKLELHNSTVYYDGKTLWNYLHGPDEVNISEPQKESNSDIINHPHQIFDIYEKDFKYKYVGNETRNGQELHVIDLYPRELDKDYSRIRLFLKKGEIQIHSAKIFAKDGARYTIEIDNVKTNQPLTDSTFVFNKKEHPDVEVIDMRF